MNAPKALVYDSTRKYLYVSQTGNNRVTVYDLVTITDGENAINVLGQTNFTNTAAATTQAGMSSPSGLAYNSSPSRLYVAQSGNHRVTVYDLGTITDGENATYVLGQPDFITGTSTVSQTGLSSPQGLEYDSTNNRLYVADTTNDRVMVFDAYEPTSTISGNVYTDEGITPIANGKTVRLLINGANAQTTTTSGGTGAYSFTYSNPAAGDIVTVHIDGATEDGVTILKHDGTSNYTSTNIYQDHIVINSGSLTAANLNTANDGDADLITLYTDGTTPVIQSGKELYIPSGTTFTTPAATSLTVSGNIEVLSGGTLALSATSLVSIAGNLINAGTMSVSAGATLTFNGGSAQTLAWGSSALALPVTITGVNTVVSLATNTLNTTSTLTIDTSSGATLNLGSLGLTVGGTFSNDGIVQLNGSNTISITQDTNSGTWQYVGDGTGAATTHTIKDFGATDYYNLIIYDSSASNDDTFTIGAAFKVAGNLTVSDGTLTGSNQSMDVDGSLSIGAAGAMTSTSGTITVGGNMTNAGTFTHNNGTVTLDGVSQIITPTTATTFYTLTKTETTNDSTNSTFQLAGNITIANNLTLDGLDSNDKILVTSSSAGVARSITFTGSSTLTADFLTITDNTLVDSSTGITLEVNPANSTNGGNTIGWITPSPTVTNVTSSTTDGSYNVPDVISIQVTFSAAVTVTGTPQLTLETGTTDRAVNYSSGSGTTVLTFTYTISAGDTSSDLDYTSTGALALNGGTIVSSYGSVAATLTLASPGAAGSLGANKALVVDTTAPAITGTPDMTAATDTGTSNTDNITNDSTPNFTISCETGTTVELYSGVTSLGTGTCASSTITITSSVLADGTYSLTAYQTDGAGNISSVSGTLAITIDTVAPSAPSGTPDLDATSDTGFSNTDNITNDTTPLLNGTGATASSVIKIYDNGTLVCSTTANGLGNWSCTTSVLSESTHSNLTVRESDTAGNESVDSGALTISIDNTSPTGSFTTGTFTNAVAGNQTITFTTADNASGFGVQADAYIVVTDSVMGTLTPTCGSVFPTTGNTTITCTVDISTAASAEETHVISVTTTDKAGKSIGFTSPNYIIDRKAPVITSFVIDPLTVTPADFSDPVITFSATDGVAVDHYELDVNGGGYSTQTSPYAMTGASTSSLNTVNLKVIDTVGNVVVQVAKFYPIITITAPTVLSNTSITNTTIKVLTGAPAFINSVSSDYNGSGTSITCVPALATLPVNTDCTLDSGVTTTGVLSVDASEDLSGTTIPGAQATQTYIIETVIPTITPTTPTLVSQSTITNASFVVADVNGVASVDFSASTAGNTFSCTPSPSSGSNVSSTTCTGNITSTGILAFTVTDRAGNTNSYSGNFYIDAVNPTISAFSPIAGLFNATQVVSFTVQDTNSGIVPGDVVITGGTGGSCTAVDAQNVSCTVNANTTTSISVSATDKAGNTATAGPSTYTIDLVYPTLTTLTSTKPSGQYTTGATITITATYSETLLSGGTLTVTLDNGRVIVLSGTGGTTLSGTYTVLAGDTNTNDLHIASLSSESVSDAAGNVTTTSTVPVTNINTAHTYVIDTIADAAPGTPDLKTADDSGTSDTDDLTNATTPRFDISCVTGSTVSLKSGGTVYGTNVCVASTVTITSSVLTDGVYSFFAYQTDAAGNISANSSTLAIVIDTTAPATLGTPDLDIASDSGTSSSDDITNDTTPTFTGSCTTGDAITLYDGVFNVGTFTCVANVYTITTSVLSEAVHSITVTATDSAGNISSPSSTLSVTIDTTALGALTGIPNLTTASDTGILNNDDLTYDTTPSFTIACTTGNLVTLKETATVYGTGMCALGTVTITVSPAFGEGVYNFFSYQEDLAGNMTADSGTLTVTIDTTAPSNPVSAPDLDAASDTGASNTDDITYDPTPTFTGSCVTGDTVTLYHGAIVLGTVVCASNAYTITTSTLSDGTYTITTTFTDDAGNESSVSPGLSVTIDTTLPANPSTPDLDPLSDSGSSSTDDLTNDSTPTFTLSCVIGTTVKLLELGVIQDSGVCTTGTISLTTPIFVDGTYAFYSQQTDVAGNDQNSVTNLTVEIDTTEAVTGTPNMTSGTDTGSSSTDNITNNTTPDFTISCDTDATVDLYQGATLLGTGTCVASTVTITSSALAEGTYTIKAQQTDLAGNISALSTGLSITIDTTADAATGTPDLTTDTGTSSNDDLTNDATPDFTVSCVSGSIVKIYDNVTQVGSGTCAVSTVTITTSTLVTGAHTITAKQTDTAGNISVASAGLSVTIDTTADAATGTPDLTTDTGTSSTDNITTDTTPDFTISCVNGSTVELWINGVASGQTALCGVGLSVTLTSTTLSPDGTYTITAKQTDTAGNISVASAGLSVTIDTTADAATGTPDLTTDTGTSSTDNITTDTTPDFTISCVNGSTVELWINGVASGQTALCGVGLSVTLTSTTLSPDGTYTITAKQTDTAGNISVASAGLSVTIDTTADAATGTPDLTTDTGTSSTDNITNDPTPDFTISCVTGSLVTLYDNITSIGTGTCATSTVIITASTLSDGTYTTINATQTDPAGNISAVSGNLSVTIDTTADAATGTPDMTTGTDSGASNTDNITADTTPDFTISCVNGSTVELYIGGVASGQTALCGVGLSVTLTSIALTPDGAFTITAKQTDTAGNISSLSGGLSVTIDTTEATTGTPDLDPASDTGTLSTDNITSDTTPDFTISCVTGNTVNLYNGATLLGTGTCAGSTITITSNTLTPDGTYTITAKQTDTAGNTSVASSGLSVTIDSTAPTAPGLAPDLSTDTGSSSTDNITNDNTPSFTGTCTTGEIVTLYDNLILITTVTCAGSAYTITSTVLTDGSHPMNVTFKDTAGNESAPSTNLSITIDTAADATTGTPDLTTDTGTSNTDNITNDNTPDFTISCVTGSTVILYDNVTQIGTGVCSGSTVTITASTLADGTHASINATQTDVAGNVSVVSGNLSVVIDTTEATTGTPDLQAGSDNGASSTDNITNDTTPTFDIACVTTNTVELYIGGVATGVTGTCVGSTVSLTTGVLTAGTYTIIAKQTDTAGNTSLASTGLSVTIDTTADAAPGTPDLDPASDTGVSSTDNNTADNTPTFTISCVSGSTITLYDDVTPVGTALCAGSTATVTASTLADGTHPSINATQTDTAGNISATSGNLSITIDTAPPADPTMAPDLDSASDTGTSNSDNITSGTTPTFTGTCTATLVDSVNLYDGATLLGNATCTVGNTYTVTSSTLTNGAHTITIKFENAGGIESTGSSPSLSVTIDTTADAATGTPDLTTDTGTSSTDNITTDTTPDFTISCVNGSTVELWINGVASGQTALCGVGLSVTLTSTTLSPDGTYTITAKQTDTAGNISVASASLSVTIDTTADAATGTPDLQVASDTGTSSTDNVTADDTPTLDISCVTGSTVELYVNGVATGITGVCALSTVTLTTLALAPNGTYTITAKQTDTAGNISPLSAGLSVTIDTTADAVTGTPDLQSGSDTGISSTDNTTIDTTPTFDISCVNGSTVELWIDGVATGVTGTCTASTVSLTSSNLTPDGIYSITVKQADTAGNISVVSPNLSITIDTTADVATGTPDMTTGTDSGASNTDNITSDTTPDFTISCVTGSTVTLYDNVTSIGTGFCALNTVTITASTLSDGTHASINATQTDTAGNVSAASGNLSVVIDTTADSATGAPDMTAATDTGTLNTDNITADTTPDFAISCNTASTVTLLDGGVNIGTGVCVGGTVTITASVLSNTLHTITAKQTDTAGNTSVASSSLSVIVDTTASTPNIPATLTATAGNAQVTLNWSAPAISVVAPITDYKVEYTVTGGVVFTTFVHAASTTPSIIVTGLTNGTAYDFQVSAVNGFGTGSPFTPVVSATPVAPSSGGGGGGGSMVSSDLCTNIPGIQSTVPLGYTSNVLHTCALITQAGSNSPSAPIVPTTPKNPLILHDPKNPENPVPPVPDQEHPNEKPNVPEDLSPYVCTRYMQTYILPGVNNDSEAVIKLQRFLNENEGESLVLSGVYDDLSIAAVKRFQSKYADQILTPWGVTKPTGRVYVTTTAKINLLYCTKFNTKCPYFTQYLKQGDETVETVRLQDFLNLMSDPTVGYPAKSNLTLGKLYDSATTNAVKSFQSRYRNLTLKPWGLETPTGNFYQTTRSVANKLMNCPEIPTTLRNGVVIK